MSRELNYLLQSGGIMAAKVIVENLNGSEPTASRAPKNGSNGKSTARGPGSTSIVRKTTGPRTQLGKERSKHNAVKHGIFSKVVVLKGESQAEFDVLLNRLRNDCQPAGTLEELLVEKLAVLFWRQRRLLIAEGAEIRANSEFVEWDGRARQFREAVEILPRKSDGGLIRWVANPNIVQVFASRLKTLKEGIETGAFVPESGYALLDTLYGTDNKENWPYGISLSYGLWAGVTALSEEERKQRGLPSPQEAKEDLLAGLREVIESYSCYM